jgi:hypothetical protein
VHPGADVFRLIIRLPPWSEQAVAGLLRDRTEASGYAASYDDLVIDDVGVVERQAHLLSTEQNYMRLLWDYAEGCPRVAIHFWRLSLAPDGERRVRVRLFRGPEEHRLEELGEPERFVLASAVWHGSITADEAARSLRYPPLSCEDALARLDELGVLAEHDGRHRVTTRWQRAVTTYLVRKHLIQP